MKLGRRLQLSVCFAPLLLSSCVTRHATVIPNYDVMDETFEKKESIVVPQEPAAAPSQNDSLNRDLAIRDHKDRPEVQKWIKYYAYGKGRSQFERYLERGAGYRRFIEHILGRYELPSHFYYMAMLESGFNTHARSHASAVGVWQFISSTAKRYGLRVNRYIDERRDPLRATIAAAHFLKDLKNVFDSWYLAMSAYNAGESRIMNVIMRAGTRDYWELCDKKALPPETRQYVPRFMALAEIGENLNYYGFKAPESPDNPHLVSVTVPSPVRLKSIAEVVGIRSARLKKLNPHILKNFTPPIYKDYRVWIPEDVENSGPLLARLKRIRLRSEPSVDTRYHRVRRGETLASIARKYRTSIRKIKKLNRLRSNRIYAGSKIKVAEVDSVRKYRVKRGDSLSSISQKFNTSIKKLKKVNRLKRSRIYAGQLLLIADNR